MGSGYMSFSSAIIVGKGSSLVNPLVLFAGELLTDVASPQVMFFEGISKAPFFVFSSVFEFSEEELLEKEKRPCFFVSFFGFSGEEAFERVLLLVSFKSEVVLDVEDSISSSNRTLRSQLTQAESMLKKIKHIKSRMPF